MLPCSHVRVAVFYNSAEYTHLPVTHRIRSQFSVLALVRVFKTNLVKVTGLLNGTVLIST